MKRPTVIILIIVLILIAGVGAYEANHTNTKTATVNAPKTSTTKKAVVNSFAPVSTSDLPYVATITTPAGDGTTNTATLASDGQGTTQYSATGSGQTVQITYTSDFYYTCSVGKCYKYPVSQSASSGFDPSAYTYTAAQLATYRSSAIYKGKKPCPAGTCDTWSVTNAGITSTLFIDSQKRISQVQTSQADKTSTVSFDYKAVNITIPANAQSISTTP